MRIILALTCLATILWTVSGTPRRQRSNQPSLVFSDRYSVGGVIFLPYAEIKEPFQCYYDKANKRSRVDYYGNMVNTYQREDRGSSGISYKIAYMPDENGDAKRTCFQVNGTSGNSITVQSVVPDLTNFTFSRMEACPDPADEILCELWTYIVKEGQKTNKYKMWLQRSAYDQSPIPNYYEMKGYNSLLGSHYDKYQVKYYGYNTNPLPDTIFDVNPKLKCRGFPGPGMEHVAEHNPIKEFIDNHDDHVHAAFDKFKTKHNKQYEHPTEHETRKSNFRQNYRYINSKNRAGLTFSLAVNHLTDFGMSELKMLRGRTHIGGYNGGQPFLKSQYPKNIPQDLDWRLFGAVTPVKDQAICGSCWSFGTVGTIEGAHFLKTGNLIKLAEQQLVDCSWPDMNNGCDGGEDYRAYKYIIRTGGLATDDDYGPYLGQDGRCHDKEVNKTVQIQGYVNVTSGDAEALRIALAKKGPISVSIDASHKSFTFYANGVYYEQTCGKTEAQLDHSVLAVGYGVMNGEPYWLIKNSWSTYWGNDGYVLMSAKENNCGVETSPTYVIM